MKTLVAYFSQTGNTKKVAESMFDVIQGEKEIKELSEVENVDGYDLLFVGFPIDHLPVRTWRWTENFYHLSV